MTEKMFKYWVMCNLQVIFCLQPNCESPLVVPPFHSGYSSNPLTLSTEALEHGRMLTVSRPPHPLTHVCGILT